mmetsp:Transcript_56981/g.132873  ORF Transcript_56981/g.132873 Transcript_56981/m.132873 type:complete len:312 (+) Transcript_56981:872-1807(+)
MHLVEQRCIGVAVVEADKVAVQLLFPQKHRLELEGSIVAPRPRTLQSLPDELGRTCGTVASKGLRRLVSDLNGHLGQIAALAFRVGVRELQQGRLHCRRRSSLLRGNFLGRSAQASQLVLQLRRYAGGASQTVLQVRNLVLDEAQLHLQRLHSHHLTVQLRVGAGGLEFAAEQEPSRLGPVAQRLQQIPLAVVNVQTQRLAQRTQRRAQRLWARAQAPAPVELGHRRSHNVRDHLRPFQLNRGGAALVDHHHEVQPLPLEPLRRLQHQLHEPLSTVPTTRGLQLQKIAREALQAIDRSRPHEHLLDVRALG